MWLEDSVRWRKHFQEEPSEMVLKRWLQQPGIHALVGEPGGGKTTLLRTWAHDIVAMPEKQLVPFYVPLREVTTEGLSAYFAKPKDQGGYGLDISPYLGNEPPFRPVWLFDGLDELPNKDLKERWLGVIKGLKQHSCIVSCRTALYNSDLRRTFGEPHYLMGLYPNDQKAFLQRLAQVWREYRKPGFEDATDAWVDELHGILQQSQQLRRLAGSPLLLRLIALTNSPKRGIQLPTKRVDFYREAFEELLRTRTDISPDDPIPNKLVAFLSSLAYEVSHKELLAEVPKSTFRDLVIKHQLANSERHILMKSGILKVMEDGNFQWLHQTFQEWLLAEALAERQGLLQTVKTYWLNPRYEETLSLLWGLATPAERHEATRYLIAQGCQRSNPGEQTHSTYRSGLRTALHLWSRSGVSLDGTATLRLLQRGTLNAPLIRIAIALDSGTPIELLRELAKDRDPNVRIKVAGNANTPAELLRELAKDRDLNVRIRIAGNPNTPAELLHELTKDRNPNVRQRVTENTNIPAELLRELAKDRDPNMCIRVAKKIDTCLEWLKRPWWIQVAHFLRLRLFADR